jgi:hypothetical protein
MRQGRKSAAELAVVSIAGEQPRPKPPMSLCDEEKRYWKQLVDCMPHGWFPPETWGFLTAYCRELFAADETASQINEMRRLGLQKTEDFHKLLDKQSAHTKVIMNLATKMRLTQQSTYDQQTSKKRQATNDQEDPW